MRLYLNNILFGATQGPQPGGGFFTPGTGAINPAALGLGTGAGEFGSSTFTNNAFGSIFKIGTKGVGLPIGAQFKTAPGNFAAQTDSAMNFMMVDSVTSTTRSSTWVEFQALPVGDRSGHPQVVTVATIERIPESPGAITPTPEANLDDYFPTGSPASNPERNKSIYAGNAAYGEDDPQQARSVHVVAFKSFFLIDPANQDPVTTSAAIDAHFVAAKWRDGEVRGYFLGEVIPPEAGVVYPASPTADPR